MFSQYYDTAFWIASELAKTLPDEPVAVYAGTGKSGIFHGDDFASVEREEIKKAVKTRQIRLVVATDAACEGLNLQTLGTLINVDLPWNPSRLEQRLGRIKRFGQARHTVDMLNLVYHDTQDEEVYQVLSRRMKDRFDIFGGLPDTIDDEWIENVETLEEMMDKYFTFGRKHVTFSSFAIRRPSILIKPLGTLLKGARQKRRDRKVFGIVVTGRQLREKKMESLNRSGQDLVFSRLRNILLGVSLGIP